MHNECQLGRCCYQNHLSLMSHQFQAQCMSTGMMLLSGACVTMSLSHHDSIHVHSECPLTQRCHQRSVSQSLPSLSFMHTAMSAEWCCQAGSPKHCHFSSTMFHTHTHPKCTMRNGAAIKGHQSQLCLVNSPFLYTMTGDITHRRPLPSHTNSPS